MHAARRKARKPDSFQTNVTKNSALILNNDIHLIILEINTVELKFNYRIRSSGFLQKRGPRLFLILTIKIHVF